MRISEDTHEMTLLEFDRFHMHPAELCSLAGIGSLDGDEAGRKYLANLSGNQLLPFEKYDNRRTSPKLYSLRSAIMLRTTFEITQNGRSYDFGISVARGVAHLAERLITELRTVDDLYIANDCQWFISYQSSGRSVSTIALRRTELYPKNIIGSFDGGLFAAGKLIWEIFKNYPNYWLASQRQIGSPVDLGRYHGFDEMGLPLDPNAPSNANLPPVARAKRRLEIEMYIARRSKEAD